MYNAFFFRFSSPNLVNSILCYAVTVSKPSQGKMGILKNNALLLFTFRKKRLENMIHVEKLLAFPGLFLVLLLLLHPQLILTRMKPLVLWVFVLPYPLRIKDIIPL